MTKPFSIINPFSSAYVAPAIAENMAEPSRHYGGWLDFLRYHERSVLPKDQEHLEQLISQYELLAAEERRHPTWCLDILGPMPESEAIALDQVWEFSRAHARRSGWEHGWTD